MRSPAILAFRRHELERWIENAIALLDQMDGDTDYEDDEKEIDDAEFDVPGLIKGSVGR